MTWREKVLSIMEDRGMTQKQLSELSGITESSISRYLHSDKRPRIDIVINVARALKVDTDYLLDDKDTEISAFEAISTAIARKGSELSAEEKNQLIALLLKRGNDVQTR